VIPADKAFYEAGMAARLLKITILLIHVITYLFTQQESWMG